MKPANIQVQTSEGGKKLGFKYQLGDVNPYTMIGILERIIQDIKTKAMIAESSIEKKDIQ